MSKHGILLIISGLSGAGKGTICKRLLEKYPGEYSLSISVTSRAPRSTEKDGREYFFKTREEFEQMIEDDLLLEHADYVGNYYGTPKQWVEDKMQSGSNVILEIEIQGGFQVKKKMPEAVMIFILPPSMEELERRLRERGTETEEQIQKRLARAVEEKAFAEKYDYVIINEIVENSVDMVHNIMLSEKKKLLLGD